jgi:hypothetical protein
VLNVSGTHPTFHRIIVNGRDCCEECFKLAYGFDKSVWAAARKAVGLGYITKIDDDKDDGKDGRGQGEKKSDDAAAWINEKLAENDGNASPLTGRIMMDRPDRMEWYSEYSMDRENVNQKDHAKPGTFYRALNKCVHEGNFEIRKHMQFARCAICHSLRQELLCTRCPDQRSEIRRKRTQHVKDQYEERKVYYARREKAISQPETYMSIIIDGMDQSKLTMPHFTRDHKGNADGLKNALIGVLIHGVAFKQYVVPHTMKGGANETITCLALALKSIQEDYAANNKPWPRVLFLQLDNTCKDNKNRAVLTFLEELVRTKVFACVYNGYLYVGHTHEDIDQRFSTIARALRTTNVYTMTEMLELLKNTNATDVKEKYVSAEVLKFVYDYSGWFKACVDPNFGQFMKHHVFRFTRIKTKVLNKEHNRFEIVEQTRLHVKEWARKDKKKGVEFPWVPSIEKDASFGFELMDEKKRKLDAYKQRDRIRIAKFDGTLNEEGKRKVMNSVRNQAKGGMNAWGVPRANRMTPHRDIDSSPLVQDWETFLSLLPVRSEDVDYTDARPVFLPWPQPCEVAREPVRETRPDLRTESEPLGAPIRGSRTSIDGAQPDGRRERIRHGRGVVEGPITGQGNAGMEKVVNEHTLVDHEGIISDEEDVPLRRLRVAKNIEIVQEPSAEEGNVGVQMVAIENALVPDGQEQGQARIHEDEEEEQAEEERHEESDEEGGAHAIEGIMGARRKVKRTLGSDKPGMELYIMWEAKESSGNNVKNWEPIVNVQNPTTVYGECFGGSLKLRSICEMLI